MRKCPLLEQLIFGNWTYITVTSLDALPQNVHKYLHGMGILEDLNQLWGCGEVFNSFDRCDEQLSGQEIACLQ